MLHYLKKLDLPENPEVLLMLILGICLQMTDGSPFSMKYRWRIVWDIELPAEYFSFFAQRIIKTILVIIIMVRCSTTYAYVVSAMLVLFSLIKKTTPKLMLLWLLVAGIKSICMTFVEAIAGIYVCSAFGKIRRPCIEFFISKALEIIFAAYLWGSVLSIYQDMENKAKKLSKKDETIPNCTFQRARSLLDESTLYKSACLNNFEFKDVPQIILHMLRRKDEISEDSLMDPGMMLASVSNFGSFDNLKTSQSLGELGLTNLESAQVVGLEEDQNLSHREKVLRFLKLTKSDVANIKLNKSTIEKDIFIVEDDIWARVMATGTQINKPKHTRPEVVIREAVQPEEIINKTGNQQKKSMKFDISFSDLLVGKQYEFQDDHDEEDSLIFSQNEEEGKEDEETIRLFMSNIKDGILIRRFELGFGLKIRKENRYEKLYKQDFMSEIGPEVFERAPNLQKVTSFTKIMRKSVSVPEILLHNKKSNITPEDSMGKIDQTSSSDFYSKAQELCKKQIHSEKLYSEEEMENFMGKISEVDEILTNNPSHSKSQKIEKERKKKQNKGRKSDDKGKKIKMTNGFDDCELSDITDKITFPSPNINVIDRDEAKELNPCFRKRRVIIKRTGNQRTIQSQKLSFDSWSSPRNSNNGSDQVMSSQMQFIQENANYHQQSHSTLFKQENSSRNIYNKTENVQSSFENKELYFHTAILKRPNWEVSITYFDVNKNTMPQEKLNSQKFGFREEKIWKSDVLKTVETFFITNYSQTSRPSVLSNENDYFFSKKKKFLEIKETNTSKDNSANEGLLSANVKSTNENIQDVDDEIKITSDNYQIFKRKSEASDSFASTHSTYKELDEKSNFSVSEYSFEASTFKKTTAQNSKTEVISYNDENGIKAREGTITNEIGMKKKLNFKTPSGTLTKKESFRRQESDESISLYYSKAANLASPLLRRFIYPDHIHCSYEHVNKKGFNVNINRGFPLLIKENLPRSTPLNVVNESSSRSREPVIKRRPMDLSFATTNAFENWQNNSNNDLETKQNQTTDNNFSTEKESEMCDVDFAKNMKEKRMKYLKKLKERIDSRVLNGLFRSKSKSQGKNFNDVTLLRSAKDYRLTEKLLRMQILFNKNEFLNFKTKVNEQASVQTSSTLLDSNKELKNSIKNPAIFLQKNKSRNEKRKIDSQEQQTKTMFAKLASEAFLTSSGSKRNI